FDTVAGRYIALCFFGSGGDEETRRVLATAKSRDVFDDQQASFFGVSVDPADEGEARLPDRYPGVRYFWDFDGGVSKLYGALSSDGACRRSRWVVLDPMLRVLE